MKKIEILTPEQNICNLLEGKKVLFLENDNSLDNGLDEFERILQRHPIVYTVLYNLSELPLPEITTAINNHDVIVFMTQWVYEISKKLFEYVKALPHKKIIIEGYITDPTWFYKTQHGSKHDVYIYKCMMHWGTADKQSERFYKLTNKPYWDYKNKFDK